MELIMNVLIEELIKAIGLPANYKAFPDVAKKFEVIDKIKEEYEKALKEARSYYLGGTDGF